MIVIIGATTLTGRALRKKLNEEFYNDLVLVDPEQQFENDKETSQAKYSNSISLKEAPRFIRQNQLHVQMVYFFPEEDLQGLFEEIWDICLSFGLFLVFDLTPKRAEFVTKQERRPYFYAGLKLPIIYGSEIEETSAPQIRVSKLEDKAKTDQMCQFIFAADLAEALYFLLHNRKHPGFFDLSVGDTKSADEFFELARLSTNESETSDPSFIDPPADLVKIGFTHKFHTLQSGLSIALKNNKI